MTATQILMLAVAGLAAFRTFGDLVPWSRLAKLPAAWLTPKPADPPAVEYERLTVPDGATAWLDRLAHATLDRFDPTDRTEALALLDKLRSLFADENPPAA